LATNVAGLLAHREVHKATGATYRPRRTSRPSRRRRSGEGNLDPAPAGSFRARHRRVTRQRAQPVPSPTCGSARGWR